MTDTVPAEVMAAIERFDLAARRIGFKETALREACWMRDHVALVAAIAKAIEAARRESYNAGALYLLSESRGHDE